MFLQGQDSEVMLKTANLIVIIRFPSTGLIAISEFNKVCLKFSVDFTYSLHEPCHWQKYMLQNFEINLNVKVLFLSFTNKHPTSRTIGLLANTLNKTMLKSTVPAIDIHNLMEANAKHLHLSVFTPRYHWWRIWRDEAIDSDDFAQICHDLRLVIACQHRGRIDQNQCAVRYRTRGVTGLTHVSTLVFFADIPDKQPGMVEIRIVSPVELLRNEVLLFWSTQVVLTEVVTSSSTWTVCGQNQLVFTFWVLKSRQQFCDQFVSLLWLKSSEDNMK